MSELEKDLFDLFRVATTGDKYNLDVGIIKTREWLDIYRSSPLGQLVCDLMPEGEIVLNSWDVSDYAIISNYIREV